MQSFCCSHSRLSLTVVPCDRDALLHHCAIIQQSSFLQLNTNRGGHVYEKLPLKQKHELRDLREVYLIFDSH